MTDRKKDFQKVIAKIRSELNQSRQWDSSYPKAMMTGQQKRKNTATVNCARSEKDMNVVLEHPAFKEYVSKYSADVRTETKLESGYVFHHIRLIFKNQ